MTHPAPLSRISDCAVEHIDTDASAFSALAFPRRRARLSTLQSPWFAIGARWRGAPVGLALGYRRDDSVTLDSVMVAPGFRRIGLGRMLLDAVTDHAVRNGAPMIEVQYSSFLAARLPLEALLAAAGWPTPTILDIQLVGLAGVMAEGGGAWRPVQRAMRELPDYTVEPFGHPDAADAEAIATLLASAPELGVPDPRLHPALDPHVSMTLRHRGAMIGWIAAERLTRSCGHGTITDDAPSILYSGARFAEGHHKAIMLLGYYRAFSRQAELYGPASRAVYRTHPAAAAMYAFTRARFAPMALHIEEHFCAARVLPTGEGAVREDSLTTYPETMSC